MTLTLVTAPDDDVRLLVGELDAVLAADYPPEHRHGLALAAIFQPHIRFFVAAVSGQPVGCAGVALFDGYAELKRMYVRPAMRGGGVAQALLARLEQEVGTCPVIRLETGPKQLAALAMYRRAGFVPCSAFGDYAMMPAAIQAASIFMEKRLRP